MHGAMCVPVHAKGKAGFSTCNGEPPGTRHPVTGKGRPRRFLADNCRVSCDAVEISLDSAAKFLRGKDISNGAQALLEQRATQRQKTDHCGSSEDTEARKRLRNHEHGTLATLMGGSDVGLQIVPAMLSMMIEVQEEYMRFLRKLKQECGDALKELPLVVPETTE
ncbi:hypothetical protein WJX72_004980 [[Myrmecia] bisecta]|uniref:Uncharacterized protein n=1 Tax=[Myrmecia] bisecta TaxID=41462 RepID=A0AAW1QF27_9CHLO